jgi:SAM-dependent methyltransferase
MKKIVEILKSVYHTLPSPPSSYYKSREISPNPIDLLQPNAVIFDIGSKGTRGSYEFGTPPADAKIVCVDISEGVGVDLVADAHDLHMVPDNSVDLVYSVSVLEHVRYPQRVVKEMHRIIKPGGLVFISVPFIFPFHADPDDFYRFSYRGIDILCEDFERLDSGFSRGPASTMHQLLVHFMAMLFCFNNRTLYGINTDLFGWLLFWVKYLDGFLAHYEMAYVIHTGSFFLGRKTAASVAENT